MSNLNEELGMEEDDECYEELYNVEKIVKVKKVKGKKLYRVKWEGYSHSQNTWEPIENLENCQKILEKFKKRNNKKRKNIRLKTRAEKRARRERRKLREGDRSQKDEKKRKNAVRLSKTGIKREGKNLRSSENGSRRETAKLKENQSDFEENSLGLKRNALGESDWSLTKRKNKENQENNSNFSFDGFKALDQMGTMGKDSPQRIKDHRVIMPLGRSIKGNMVFLVEWKQKKNGSKPLESYESRKRVKEHCPELLIDYLESLIDFEPDTPMDS